jgi:hypothetical protein
MDGSNEEVNARFQNLRVLPETAGSVIDLTLPDGVLNGELLEHDDAVAICVDCVTTAEANDSRRLLSRLHYADPYANRVACEVDPCVSTPETCDTPGSVQITMPPSPSRAQPAVAFLRSRWCSASRVDSVAAHSRCTASDEQRDEWLDACLSALPSALPATATSVAFPSSNLLGTRQRTHYTAAVHSFAKQNPQLRVYMVESNRSAVRRLRAEHVRRNKVGSAVRRAAFRAHAHEGDGDR